MAQQVINIGALPNDNTGDPLRTAYDKCNDNFTELYTLAGTGSNILGGLSGIGADQTNFCSYGQGSATEPPVMQANGKILGLAIGLNGILNTGTCEAQVTINGVAQTAVGQTVLLTAGGTDQHDSIVFGTPISYSAGDRIGLQTVTIGAAPTGRDATLIARIGDT